MIRNKKMKRQVKKVLSGAWIIVLFAVCAASYAQEADTWLPVTRMNQIAGNWEGAFAYDMPADEEAMTPAISMDLTLSLWYEEGADEIEMEMKADFERFLAALSSALGLSPSTLWESLRQGFDEDDENIQVGKYVVYYSQRGPVDEMVGDENAMLINTSGTKLRFSESALAEIGNFPIADFILYRK
jgi:hypothetical protein